MRERQSNDVRDFTRKLLTLHFRRLLEKKASILLQPRPISPPIRREASRPTAHAPQYAGQKVAKAIADRCTVCIVDANIEAHVISPLSRNLATSEGGSVHSLGEIFVGVRMEFMP